MKAELTKTITQQEKGPVCYLPAVLCCRSPAVVAEGGKTAQEVVILWCKAGVTSQKKGRRVVSSAAEITMSLASKVTLGAACCVTAAIVGYVHLKQSIDREKLHEGVIRDVERQQRRKAENVYLLQQQSDLTKQLRQEQQQREAAQQAATPT
ncbi:uncharacterized protein LOC135094679 isoform X2 [Scylla paramamosain]|uniref:uncharacterized protein LOC135094679 isoform X2 n=1 Tax=Scylla paramamosain TaxID=85552 RepID=UPI003082BB3A